MVVYSVRYRDKSGMLRIRTGIDERELARLKAEYPDLEITDVCYSKYSGRNLDKRTFEALLERPATEEELKRLENWIKQREHDLRVMEKELDKYPPGVRERIKKSLEEDWKELEEVKKSYKEGKIPRRIRAVWLKHGIVSERDIIEARKKFRVDKIRQKITKTDSTRRAKMLINAKHNLDVRHPILAPIVAPVGGYKLQRKFIEAQRKRKTSGRFDWKAVLFIAVSIIGILALLKVLRR